MSERDPVSIHRVFLEAASILQNAGGGASVLMLEWAHIQRLVEEASRFFDDLPIHHAPEVKVEEKRGRWKRSTVRAVRQMYLAGFVQHSIDDSDTARTVFDAKIFLLGEDGVLRIRWEKVWFDLGDVPLEPGWMGVEDPRWIHMADLEVGTDSEPAAIGHLGSRDTEELLTALSRLATLTRDQIAARLGRLGELG